MSNYRNIMVEKKKHIVELAESENMMAHALAVKVRC